MSTGLDVDEWADVDDSVVADPVPPTPALHFPTLPAFVSHLATWYRREVFDSRERVWCPDWWRHPEAVVRLEAMWRTLEPARIVEHGDGISAWLRDHADVHMAQLMHPAGPFRGCTARGGHSSDPLPPLPVNDPPEDWWTRADSGL